MAVRRFGPTLGAGVVIIEQEAEKVLEAAPLGVTLYITPLDHGSLTDLISTFSKRDMQRKVGGLISGFDGPDCAADFWDHSNGAGELHFLRVARSGAAAPRAASLDSYSKEMKSTAGDTSRAVIRAAAKNGGRWGSQKRVFWRVTTLLGDIGTTTLTTGQTMLQDEWVGGVVQLDGVTTREYAIIANSTAGVVTVSSESNMAADLAAAPSVDQGYTLLLRTRTGPEGRDRAIMVEYGDGEQNPTSEFSLNVFVNEELVRRYPDLSMDPASARYFLRLINDDQGNEEITVTDLLTPGLPTADRRPANEEGVVSAITATTLTSRLFQLRNNVVGTANPTAALGVTTDTMQFRDVLRFEVTAVGGGNATIRMTSRRIGGGSQVHADVVAANVATTAFVFGAPTSPLVPPVTITCGSTIFTLGDIFEVDYFPFEIDKLIGGLLVPDFVNSNNTRFRITDNDHKTITVSGGDLIVDGLGAVNDRFLLVHPQELGGSDLVGPTATNGYDGLAGLSDADYTVLMGTTNSRVRDLLGQNKGLVKLATPDRTATAVVLAGMTLAESLNWQYRVEIPDTVVTESAALNHINNTVGRNDFAVTVWPSYADVDDPERPGQLKRIPVTGMVHGREALVAKNFDGYHKAAAGIDVSLPRIVKLPFTNTINEEATNPQGINVIKKVKGRFIIWGDRTIALDPAFKFKHQRELLSHYENRLREGFDFIIFAINDPTAQQLLLSTLRAFFLPEFAKGAIRPRAGKGFEDAVSIKIDADNNTELTAAAGDLFADIAVRLADTVERFIIRIGKAGIFESVQPA